MKVVKFLVLALALALGFSACGKPKNTITLEEAKAGRDQELFREAMNAIRKGRHDEGRILLNTLMNTYQESPLLRIAKLAIADSFYIGGGSKGLAQAEVEYRDWVQFFPTDDLADDVMLKMAEIHLRQVVAPDRDTTHARQAERQLQELLRRFPNTDKKAEVEARTAQVQEILAMHELKVARFSYELRNAAPGTQLRTEEILNKYPNFSRFDEALWLHARAMADQEDTETAGRDLARIVRSFPHSEYRPEAEALLKQWGMPVPEPDPEKLAEGPPDGKGMASRLVSFVFGPKIDTSPKGVIIDPDLKTEEMVARAKELGGAPRTLEAVTPGAETTTNERDARPRRATGASQDVQVRPGTPSEQTGQASSTSFKLTNQSLKDLKSEGLPSDVLKKLESLKNKEFSGAEEFLAVVKTAIGNEQADKYQSLILKHATSSSKGKESKSDGTSKLLRNP
ncbi:MAG: outer membrane protein assembly factor BamD [Blastocatellia bacterium]|nr:outer membrane protein assembly factor BamD [Blastocatellia bacterium]